MRKPIARDRVSIRLMANELRRQQPPAEKCDG